MCACVCVCVYVVTAMCAILSGVIAVVCDGTSDDVVCVMCSVASAAIGVCVPSAAVTGVYVVVHYLVLHGTLEEILETPE